MVKIQDIEFLHTVGGRWSVGSINTTDRTGPYVCERSDDAQTFYVSKIEHEKVVGTVSVGRHIVRWWSDAPAAEAKKGKAA